MPVPHGYRPLPDFPVFPAEGLSYPFDVEIDEHWIFVGDSMAAAYSAAVDSAVDEGFEDPEKLLSEFTPTFPTTSTSSISSKKNSEEQTNNSQGEVRLPLLLQKLLGWITD